MLKKITSGKILTTLILIISFAIIGSIGVSYYIVKNFTGKAPLIKKVTTLWKKLSPKHTVHTITFRTPDNIELAGILLEHPKAKRNILLCHGYRSCKEHLKRLVTFFPHDNILLFDYRAHGQSSGNTVTIGYDEQKDVLSALNFLEKHKGTKKLPIYGIGISMGAVSLLGATTQYQGKALKAIVIDSAFNRLDEQVSHTFTSYTGLPKVPFMSFTQLMYEYFFDVSMADINTAAWAENITIPVLVVHSKDDTHSPLVMAENIYDSLKGPKKMWQVESCEHGKIFKSFPKEYQEQVNNFFGSSII